MITDIRTHSRAASWIVTVARAGIMDPFPNHGFQPLAVVRRIDLAQVVNRLLGKVVEATPRQPHIWLTARLSFPDLAVGHVAYPAASAAVASGAMATGANNSFQPSALVTGQEAATAIEEGRWQRANELLESRPSTDAPARFLLAHLASYKFAAPTDSTARAARRGGPSRRPGGCRRAPAA